MKRIVATVGAAILLLWAVSAAAQQAREIKSHEDFGDYRVFYSVFNSEFIKPEIAQNYQLVRAGDRAFVNISVVEKDGGTKGLAAQVAGNASNLMQQSRKLEFTEIRDGDAIYYLAPMRFDDEETMTFNVQVTLPNGRTETVTFRRKLERE